MSDSAPPWALEMGWTAWPTLVVVIAVMFYAQAVVCEERYGPTPLDRAHTHVYTQPSNLELI